MNKIILKKIIIIGVLGLVLSGCSDIDDRLRDVIVDNSGIYKTEDYKQYQSLLAEGKLDEQNQYIHTEIQANLNQESQGTIRVSFGENRYLEMKYFKDAEGKVEVDPQNCYLNPKDSIYVSEIKTKNENSNLYRLAGFRILEYNKEGNVVERQQVGVQDLGLIYEIPATYTGTELAILPLGEYPKRELSTRVYFMAEDGKEKELESIGMWYVNNVEIKATDKIFTVSALDPYILKYDFEEENYFWVGNTPERFNEKPEEDGYVEFWEASPLDKDLSYSVELHPYLSLSLQFEENATVMVNRKNPQEQKKNSTWTVSKLKFGDTVTVETTGKLAIVSGDYRNVSAIKEGLAEGKTRYLLKIGQQKMDNKVTKLRELIDVNREFVLTLEEFCEHGKCIYTLDGKEVSGNIRVKESQVLKVKYQLTDADYRFVNGNGGFFGLFKKTEETVTIPITEDLDGQKIYAEKWVEIEKKEKK